MTIKELLQAHFNLNEVDAVKVEANLAAKNLGLPAPFTTFTEAALASEIQNDPISMGYAAAVTDALAKGNDKYTAVANLLNLLSGVGSAAVYKIAIPVQQVLEAMFSVPADFMALTSLQLQQLAFMMDLGSFDATNTGTGTIFAEIYASKPNTIAAFTVLAQQTGSRAQVLWGLIVGTITPAQVQATGVV